MSPEAFTAGTILMCVAVCSVLWGVIAVVDSPKIATYTIGVTVLLVAALAGFGVLVYLSVTALFPLEAS